MHLVHGLNWVDAQAFIKALLQDLVIVVDDPGQAFAKADRGLPPLARSYLCRYAGAKGRCVAGGLPQPPPPAEPFRPHRNSKQ